MKKTDGTDDRCGRRGRRRRAPWRWGQEQTAGLYAEKLAAQGFIALAFDASHQGASGGLPLFLDDPMKRVGDIYSAVDYLTTLDCVDHDRIGSLGICAGA